MKKQVLLVLMGILAVAPRAFAQQKTVTGKITNEQGLPLTGASIVIKGTSTGTYSNNAGTYSIRAEVGQVLQYRFIGTGLVERTVGAEDVINVALRQVALSLDAVEVTALGATAERRALGTAQQTIQGTEIPQTQREDFVNALQGRIAGVDVTSTSGLPGAASAITIRRRSSIIRRNQALVILE